MRLKPCPFCGKQPATENFSTETWGNVFAIACDNPDCAATVKIVCDKSKAIKEWNTRAEEPAEKTAHWDINTDGYYPFCSHCGEATQHMSPFCSNCGSKMITRRHEDT